MNLDQPVGAHRARQKNLAVLLLLGNLLAGSALAVLGGGPVEQAQAVLLVVCGLLAGGLYHSLPAQAQVVERGGGICDWPPAVAAPLPERALESRKIEVLAPRVDPLLRQHQHELLRAIEQSQADMHFATQLAQQSGKKVASSAGVIGACRPQIRGAQASWLRTKAEPKTKIIWPLVDLRHVRLRHIVIRMMRA